MRVESLDLRQFRNFSQISCQFHPDTNLIYGENAQGKTNLLEALLLLSRVKSPRSQKEQDLIQFGCEFATVTGTIVLERPYQLQIQLQSGRKKKLWKNEVVCQRNSEFTELFQTVLFCPEDLALVKAGSGERRQFLDIAIGQLRPQYALALGEYRKLLQHKSHILRKQSPDLLATLPEFNHRMAQTGTMLIYYRAHFIKRLAQTLPQIHREFSGNRETVEIAYQTVSSITDSLAPEEVLFAQVLAHQEKHLQAELASGRCLTGPHRDDIHFLLNGYGAKDFGSQGQCRSLAISMKLAEREIFFQELGEYPVLLLDDVLSELDFQRQEYVLNRIRHGQTFLTCCHKEGFHGLKEGGLFGINQGAVIE